MQVVRLARVEDAEAIARIYNQGIEERIATFETEPRSVEQIASDVREAGDRYPRVVVVRDGQVIAWASVHAYRARDCYRGVGEHSVYSDRGARGTGCSSRRANEDSGNWSRASLLKMGRAVHCTAKSDFAKWASIAATRSSTASGRTVSSWS